jgi:hypothetical protein
MISTFCFSFFLSFFLIQFPHSRTALVIAYEMSSNGPTSIQKSRALAYEGLRNVHRLEELDNFQKQEPKRKSSSSQKVDPLRSFFLRFLFRGPWLVLAPLLGDFEPWSPLPPG